MVQLREWTASMVPPTLKDFLEDPTILKVGVGIRGDIKRLKVQLDVNVRGGVDLRCWVKKMHTISPPSPSLKGLVQHFLGFEMKKVSIQTHKGAFNVNLPRRVILCAVIGSARNYH